MNVIPHQMAKGVSERVPECRGSRAMGTSNNSVVCRMDEKVSVPTVLASDSLHVLCVLGAK